MFNELMILFQKRFPGSKVVIQTTIRRIISKILLIIKD